MQKRLLPDSDKIQDLIEGPTAHPCINIDAQLLRISEPHIEDLHCEREWQETFSGICRIHNWPRLECLMIDREQDRAEQDWSTVLAAWTFLQRLGFSTLNHWLRLRTRSPIVTNTVEQCQQSLSGSAYRRIDISLILPAPRCHVV